ncbi:putative sucrose transport protein (plasmid) [Selenomonas ruminantium subsp. lactilytica TAM6421]|uniref:Putative sucrose transport protein n=1 Tax=Selenomonas ruminantium subsp. lactilytica (strain NBRC 103574 / TAM6421) TaxID=927704 RepID=I0GW41_SELRL|nr:oligosaccharide MFS transporter [Selenomonas ruminantium]BAL84978.1 putative sucrose transport protein [Selenomonas ruminantium subsp. lactilytica TAM6421]
MKFLQDFSNPFYRMGSLQIMLFFGGWGIWWSFFQIWLTTKQGFSGTQVGTIFSFGSAAALLLMFVYGSIQDKLGMKKHLLIALIACQVFLAPFFTWVYVPMLEANFYLGAVVGAVYLAVSYLAACPVFEAVTERMSRRFHFEYGQARAWGSFGYAISALAAGFLFTVNPYLVFWTGSAVSTVLLLTLLFMKPEKKEENLARFEDKSESQKDSKTPTMKDILGVFKIADLWKIIGFVMMSWTFYTVFDQQMFPEFFTRFFDTPEQGQQAYGVLNSIEVFLEFLMMGLVPVFMKRIGVRKAILLSCCIMILRIGGCGLASSPLGVGIIKLLHAPETALFILAIFRYFTLHFDTRISATLYMVGFQIAAQIGQIIFSAPLGALHDQIGYQQTFLVISGIVCVASLYAFVVLRKDDQCVEGQPLELEAVAE